MPIPFEISDRMMHAARLKSHSALARDLGVTPQALSNYKKRGDFPPGLVVDFAEKHGLSVDALLNGQIPDRAFASLASIIDIDITADELVYIGKALKVLRSADAMLGQVFRHSLDALVEAQDRGALHA